MKKRLFIKILENCDTQHCHDSQKILFILLSHIPYVIFIRGVQPGGVWRQMPPFLGWGDFFLTKGGMCKSKITRGKLHSGSNRNRAGKLLQLPPSNSRDFFIDYPPPLEIGPENSSTTPPRILELTGVHPPQLLRCGCAPGGNASMTQGGIDAPDFYCSRD